MYVNIIIFNSPAVSSIFFRHPRVSIGKYAFLLASWRSGPATFRHIYIYIYGVICLTVSGPSPHRSFSINSTNWSKSS